MNIRENKARLQGVPHLRGFHYSNFWLLYAQVGDFCISRRPFIIPLMRISRNEVFFKSQTLCTYNSYLTLIFWDKCIDLRPFLKYFVEAFMRPLRSKDPWGWILRIWPRKKNSLTKKPSPNLWNVRQPSIGQTIADMNCLSLLFPLSSFKPCS